MFQVGNSPENSHHSFEVTGYLTGVLVALLPVALSLSLSGIRFKFAHANLLSCRPQLQVPEVPYNNGETTRQTLTTTATRAAITILRNNNREQTGSG